jgi:hypothetical protein
MPFTLLLCAAVAHAGPARGSSESQIASSAETFRSVMRDEEEFQKTGAE